MSDNEIVRRELREAVMGFKCGSEWGTSSSSGPAAKPNHINVYLFGPQGSGKTSFIRTCFRALHGAKCADDKGLQELETSLHRSDDGTSLYSVYSLTNHICLHDTRGQREYTPEETSQLRLVLEGRARPNSLIQQRRRYWLFLREFWRSDERMQRTFSKTVMLPNATLETEPHFVFLVIDPNQQELLLEDEDFRQCYTGLLGDFGDRHMPHALLCTHGDTLTPDLRAALHRLPARIGCSERKEDVGRPKAGGTWTGPGPPPWMAPPGAPGGRGGPPMPYPGGPPPPPGSDAGYFEADSGVWEPGAPFGGPPGAPSGGPFGRGSGAVSRGAPAPPPAAPSPFEPVKPAMPKASTAGRGSAQPTPKAAAAPDKLPDIMRIITNYTDGPSNKPRERDAEGNDVQQDIHCLLVLLDALRQSDHQVMQRVGGVRSQPLQAEAESGCPLL